jgi:P-loop containing NTP hydrolase pore-1/C-terminal domain on Strawberry notch homologue
MEATRARGLREALEPPALALAAAPRPTLALEAALLARVRAEGLLTDLQLGSALQALQALSSPPRSFFLGHGPGVGKTRILAAVARHVQQTWGGGLVLWLTPNAALCKQALREAELFGLAPSALFRIASYAQLKEEKLPPAAGRLLLLDEAHLLRGSLRANAALARLQTVFEAVLYSTATAASQACHLGYMQRLGLWGAGTSFSCFSDFCQALRRWGPSASEMLAVDLKQRGLYVCSRLPAPELRELEVAPPPALEALFDEMCLRWRAARRCSSLDLRSFMRRFVTAVKCRCMLPRWRRDLLEGCAVVVVLQGTGSSCEDPGSSLLREMCRRNGVPAEGADLPLDALDELHRGLAPLPVAELTGRPVSQRQARGGEQASGNSVELARFLRGERRVLCLSAAGALGLNLTSPHDIRVYLLEAPWTPETLAQQLGRCNRATSRAPPECFSVTMKTFVEKRVEAALSGRAQTLSALSCADRTSENFSMLVWNRKLLRLVLLELAARALAERLPEEDLKELLRHARGRPSLAAEARRYALLPHLDLAEDLSAEASPGRSRRLLELLLKDNAFLAELLWPSWRASERGCLGEEQRRRAFVSLLCLQRRRLPASLAGCVLEFALPDRWCMQDLFASLPQGHQLLRADLSRFFDSAALLPLHHQRRLYRACEGCRELLGERPAAIKTVLEHCCGRKEPPPGFACTVATELLSEAERRLDVRFRNELAPCTAPRLFLTSSGHVVHVGAEEGAAWQYPGKPPLARRREEGAAAPAGPALRDHVSRASLRRFRELEARSLQQRASVAKTLCQKLTLRVQAPLQHWDRSLGTVLAAPESERHARFVGLLVASTHPEQEEEPP